MKKIIGLVMVLLLAFPIFASAGWGSKANKFKHADKNKDGRIDKHELRMEKNWEHRQKLKADTNKDGVVDAKEKRRCWMRQKSKVNTRLEKKYDADGDGWLNKDEAKEMLQHRHNYMKRRHKSKVDNPIEAQYDINSNGYIEAEEAEAIKEDLK